MSVRFEWQFDEDEHLVGERSGGFDKDGKDRLRAVLPRIWRIVGLFRERYESARTRGECLTTSQRRLHAALARTRPWLCPRGRRE